jgi:hypothetical protein
MLTAAGKDKLLAGIMHSQGYDRTDMHKILDQLPQFKGWVGDILEPNTHVISTHSFPMFAPAKASHDSMYELQCPYRALCHGTLPLLLLLVCRFSSDLVQELASCFTLYNCPPNMLLYSKGAVCDEMHVVLSGQVCCGVLDGRVYLAREGSAVAA